MAKIAALMACDDAGQESLSLRIAA